MINRLTNKISTLARSVGGSTQDGNMLGMGYITLNTFFNSLLAAILKMMRSYNIDATVLACSYRLLLLIGITSFGMWARGSKLFHTKNLDLYLIRAILGGTAGVIYTYAIKNIPLHEAFALCGAIEPVLLFVASSWLFKEKMTKYQVYAILLCSLGATIICSQTSSVGEFNYAYLLILLSSVLWASNGLVMRIISRTERVETQMFYQMFLSATYICILVFAQQNSEQLLSVWIEPQAYMLFGAAFCYLMHNVTIFYSHKNAMLCYIAPFYYMAFIFNAMFQYLMFNTTPSVMSIVGSLLIIGANTRMLMKTVKKQTLPQKEK